MPSVWRSDSGTVTAEFAMVLPVVVLVLFIALGALSLVNAKLANTALVGELATSLARGASFDHVLAEVSRIRPGARTSQVSRDGLLCLELRQETTVPLLSSLVPELVVSACVPS